jgi:hypothetical protein
MMDRGAYHRKYYKEHKPLRPKKPHRNAVKTHCPRGHEYDRGNTYIDPSNLRHCRQCDRARQTRIRRAKGIPERKSNL